MLRLLGISVVLLSFTLPTTAADPAAKRRVIVIAHRGAHAAAAENTLAAIEAAIELGCDYVEVDLRTTRDGELVLMHDRMVDRTTNGEGAVEDLTLSQIRALTVGKNEKVPTFEETLKLCRGKIKVYIDNKTAQPAAVVATVKRHKMIEDVIVYGSVDQLREFKDLNSKIWIMPSNPGTVEKIAQIRKSLKAETLDGNVRNWTPELAQAAHAAGAQIWVDNLGENDNEAGYRKSLALKVDAIQTDHPEALIKFLKSQGLR